MEIKIKVCAGIEQFLAINTRRTLSERKLEISFYNMKGDQEKYNLITI